MDQDLNIAYSQLLKLTNIIIDKTLDNSNPEKVYDIICKNKLTDRQIYAVIANSIEWDTNYINIIEVISKQHISNNIIDLLISFEDFDIICLLISTENLNSIIFEKALIKLKKLISKMNSVELKSSLKHLNKIIRSIHYLPHRDKIKSLLLLS